jgi:preprotein translocase subunit SecA
LAKWLFYDLKKSSEILKSTAFSEELTKLFKYLMEIDLSHEWQTVTSTIFQNTFSMFVSFGKMVIL